MKAKDLEKDMRSSFDSLVEKVERANLTSNLKKFKEVVESLEDLSINIENIKASLRRIEGALMDRDFNFSQNAQASKSDQVEEI